VKIYPILRVQDNLLRDYLERVKWDKSSPAPELPKDVVEKTMKKYISVYEKLTGVSF
jgi:phosphoribosylaminoimidazole-succinocarboxamide synthase